MTQETPKSPSVGKESLPCLRAALSILEYADNTEKSLREKLRRRGFSEEAVEESFSYLVEKRLFSEERYFRSFLLSLAEKKKFGKRRIFAEAAKKGFREDLIEREKREENFLCAVDFVENCAILIERAAAKDAFLEELLSKAQRSGDLSGEAKRAFLQKRQKTLQKLTASLVRFGYGSAEIRDAMALYRERKSSEE